MAAVSSVRELGSDVAARFRLSPLPGDSAERLLAESNKSAHVAACGRLARAFDGFRIEEFDQTLDDARFALFEVSDDFLEQVDLRSTIDRVLRDIDATDPVVKLADGTRRKPIDGHGDVIRTSPEVAIASAVRPFGAAEAMGRGVTVVLNDFTRMARDQLASVCEDISRVRGVPAQVNVYLSEKDAPGFGRHWDDHDVLIVQCFGRKHWEIFEPGALSPQLNYIDRNVVGDSFFSTVLEPGMGLFIPRGWGHKVSGFEGEVSAHMTIGMRRMSFQDALVEHLKTADPDVMTQWVAEGSSVPRPEIDRSDVEHALGRVRSSFESLALCGPVDALEILRSGFAGVELSLNLPGGLVFLEHPQSAGGEVAIAASDHYFSVSRESVPALALLVAGRWVGIEELQRTGRFEDESAVAHFVETFARRDLIRTRAP